MGCNVNMISSLKTLVQSVWDAPSVDVPKLIYEVRRVGASLNRILIIANAKGLLEVPELRRASGTGSWKYDAYTKD